MTHQQINTKSIARIAAIQSMYQFDSAKDKDDIHSILIRIKEFYKDTDFKSDHDIDDQNKLKLKPSLTHLDELVNYTHNNLNEIDGIIAEHLKKEWSVSTVPILLKALLRVGIAEINYFPEIPQKVILNEYTDIAADMLDESEVGFVNSILQHYSNSKHANANLTK